MGKRPGPQAYSCLFSYLKTPEPDTMWGEFPFSKNPTKPTSSSPQQAACCLNSDTHSPILTELCKGQACLCHLLPASQEWLCLGIWQVPKTKFN